MGNDDIVTRLWNWHGVVDPTLWTLVVEAKDEIERLRKLGDDLTAALEDVDGFIAFHSSAPRRVEEAIDAWQEARRG